jgi:hypothetical protein
VAEDNTEQLRGRWQRRAPRYNRDNRFIERVQFGDGRQRVCSQADGDVIPVAIGTGRNPPFYPDPTAISEMYRLLAPVGLRERWPRQRRPTGCWHRRNRP